MDMSKLPRLSNTSEQVPPPKPQEIPSAPTPPYSERGMTQGSLMGAEAWLSIAVGIILLLMTSRFLEYIASKLFHSSFSWTFSDAAGNPMGYPDTVFFWNDLGLVVFALCIIGEGLILGLLKRPILVKLALVLTIAAVGLNIFTIIKTFPILGFQILPALAIAFGIYIAIYEWALIKSQKT